MLLRQLFEAIDRTGEGNTAVVGWGRGMGHKGHMMLASSVITHADKLNGDPYFVVSRTYGPDDPLQPEEKLAIYRKVFPEKGHIFQTATDELPDLTRVLADLNKQGYTNAVVVVGADQKAAFQYLNAYNGKPNKKGEIAFTFDNLEVISRQETDDPSRGEEGPRATPMRQVLTDPSKSEEEQFAVWRDAMSPELSDEEVMDLMQKAKSRMSQMAAEKPVKKKKSVAEIVLNPNRIIDAKGRSAANPYGNVDSMGNPIKKSAAPEKVVTVQGKEYLLKSLPSDMSKVQKAKADNGQEVYIWVEKSGMRPQYTYYWYAPMKDMKETQRMSAAVKLQRAFQREQEKSAASKKRGDELMAQIRQQQAEKEKQNGRTGTN